MSSVAVRNARHTGHNVLETLGGIADGQIEKHPSTGSDPQEVLAGQQGSNAQARRLVLPDNVVAGGQDLVHWIAHVYFK